MKLRTKSSSGAVIESRYWYIFYRADGRLVRESSGSESKMVAEQLLQQRMGEAGLGIRPQQDVKNVKYDDCRAALLAEYASQNRASLRTRADGSRGIDGLDHLDKFFGGMVVTRINTDTLRRFIGQRRKEGASDPTIRRNFSLLRAMLNRARKEGRIRHQDIPYFPMPKDSEPRQGFINPDLFEKLLAALPEKLQPLVIFLYYTGCRLGAARQITWPMVNADATELVLPGAILKSRQPLTLPLVGDGLKPVSALLRKMFRSGDAVFCTTNLRKMWYAATESVGLGTYDKKARHYDGLTIHDLRRSGVRNLIRAGVPEDIAMKITGHRTRSVFSRYNIVDTADVCEALIKVGQYATAQQRRAPRR